MATKKEPLEPCQQCLNPNLKGLHTCGHDHPTPLPPGTTLEPVGDGVYRAVAVRPDPMLDLIRHGIDQKLDPESLKGLYELARQVKRDNAEEAFREAMRVFQSKCPIIPKLKEARDGDRVMYKYAPYEDLMRLVGPLLAECGLTVDFDEKLLDAGLKEYTCFVSKGVHTKTNRVVIPMIPTNKMTNPAQAAAQQQSYGRRYALTGGLNIATENEDNDGGGNFDDLIGDKSIEMLNNLIIDCEKAGAPVDMVKFLAIKGVADLGEIRQADLPWYIDQLTRKHREALAKKGKS